MRFLLGASALVALAGCGAGRREIPVETRTWLEARAGELAPVMTLPESLSGTGVDSSTIAEIIRVCDPDPELYAYFYACLADTIGRMEEPSSAAGARPADPEATSP